MAVVSVIAGHTKIALKVLKLEEELVNQIRATARIESDKNSIL